MKTTYLAAVEPGSAGRAVEIIKVGLGLRRRGMGGGTGRGVSSGRGCRGSQRRGREMRNNMTGHVYVATSDQF